MSVSYRDWSLPIPLDGIVKQKLCITTIKLASSARSRGKNAKRTENNEDPPEAAAVAFASDMKQERGVNLVGCAGSSARKWFVNFVDKMKIETVNTQPVRANIH